MEEVAGTLLRQLTAVIRWIAIEVLCETLLYWSGRALLKLFSFGQYPKRNDRAENRCILTGIFGLVISLSILFYI